MKAFLLNSFSCFIVCLFLVNCDLIQSPVQNTVAGESITNPGFTPTEETPMNDHFTHENVLFSCKATAPFCYAAVFMISGVDSDEFEVLISFDNSLAEKDLIFKWQGCLDGNPDGTCTANAGDVVIAEYFDFNGGSVNKARITVPDLEAGRKAINYNFN